MLPTEPLNPNGPGRAATLAALQKLQQELGTAIQVLRIDEATHPAVVRSFNERGLPAFVLARHGTELWRQQGLPTADGMADLLLSKLQAAAGPQPSP